MATIYTSRFSNKELRRKSYYTVGITLGKPRFSLGYIESAHCYALAPDRWMWGKSREEFRKLYFEKLDKMGIDKVQGLLDSFTSEADLTGRDVVLLCYEDVRDPAEHCHRTSLAEWVAMHTGEIIEELPDPSPVKYKKVPKSKENASISPQPKQETQYEQLSLFSC